RDEPEAGIPEQGSWQQPGLAGDLEAVAHRQHRRTAAGVFRYLAHYRAEPGNGACAQVIPVAETARENHYVHTLKIVVLVPEVNSFLIKHVLHRVIRVVVAVGTGEGDYAELHAASTDAISKSSVTGLASRRSH